MAGTTIVRPHLAARLGMVAAYVLMTALFLREPAQSFGEQLAAAFFVVAVCLVIAMALRERVELRGETVRVVRLFGEDVLARDDVVSVAQSGGRHRPAHIVLRDGCPIGSKYLDLRGRPRFGRHAGAVRIPSLLTARRLADAVGAPLTTYDGEPPGSPFPQDVLPALRTDDGRIRPMAFAFAVPLTVLLALLVAMALDAVG